MAFFALLTFIFVLLIFSRFLPYVNLAKYFYTSDCATKVIMVTYTNVYHVTLYKLIKTSHGG
jgi:hypothetical protein